MSEVRPSGEMLDGAAQLLASARARLSAAVADLALPEPLRLNDWQRNAIAGLLSRLVRGIEDELRAALAERFAGEERAGLRAALSSAHVPIALPILEQAGALSDLALVAALIRRAEEHRLARPSAETALLVDLAGDDDDEIAGQAMALLIAHGSRLDAFQDPLMARVELPAELEHSLVWTIAAALRRYLIGRHGVDAGVADEALAAAASALLAGYDESHAYQALALRLVRALDERGRLDDTLVERSLTQGSLPLFLAALSVRTALDPDSLWEILSDVSGRGPALLLAAAGLARSKSAAILFHLEGREDAVAAQLDRIDGLTAGEARASLMLWRLDPAYRAAVARLAA